MLAPSGPDVRPLFRQLFAGWHEDGRWLRGCSRRDRVVVALGGASHGRGRGRASEHWSPPSPPNPGSKGMTLDDALALLESPVGLTGVRSLEP